MRNVSLKILAWMLQGNCLPFLCFLKILVNPLVEVSLETVEVFINIFINIGRKNDDSNVRYILNRIDNNRHRCCTALTFMAHPQLQANTA